MGTIEELKHMYAQDVALVGEDEAPKRWQFKSEFVPCWMNLDSTPGWIDIGCSEYRRDPEALPLPSLDWLDAPDWVESAVVDRAGEVVVFYSGQYGDLQKRPPREWFDLMRAERESAEPDSEGWVAWQPRKMPVSPDTLVCVKRRDGSHGTGLAKAFYWWHEVNEDNLSDIIAYRVIEPASEPADDGMLTGAEADPVPMLVEDNRRLKSAGCNLAEAASRVIETSDGVHRLSIAVAGWYQALADEGYRGASTGGTA